MGNVMIRIAAFTLACSTFAGAAAAQEIGKTTEAVNQVQGSINSNVRQLGVGSGVSSNEAVSTGAASAGEFRFLDGSNLNVGEKSTVVLDQFVYDPNGGGNVVISVGKGAMRFVSSGAGGRATVVTPGAVLGVRN
jgi:hypothetical protein